MTMFHFTGLLAIVKSILLLRYIKLSHEEIANKLSHHIGYIINLQ